MNYVSTRDKKLSVSAAKAIATGIAPDGGLYCPTEIPQLTAEDIAALCKKNYRGRSADILGRFLTDFTAEELEQFAARAYADEKFGGSDTAPLVKLEDGTYILELWHGPTCAFKDMALQMLPHLLTASLKKTGEQRTACILVATSGDTGKAALDGFADVEGTKIMVYYPVDGVSTIQKLQMITQRGSNVQVCAIRGNFDDAQSAVKKIFTDKDSIRKLDEQGMTLSSANSINWGRLAPQIAYYVSAYCDMLNRGDIQMGDAINVCVPTGNFGNILAAYFAKQMGIPIAKLICASNENNVLTDFFRSGGTYDRNRPFHTTISPSMDILISSNLERLIYWIAGNDAEKNKELMNSLSQNGSYEITAEMKEKLKDFYGNFASEEETAREIHNLYDNTGYVIDPHTAVASCVYKKYRIETGDHKKSVIASTASPFKFARSVMNAIDSSYDNMEDFDLIDKLSEISGVVVPNAIEEIRKAPVLHKTVCEKDEMKQVVLGFLK